MLPGGAWSEYHNIFLSVRSLDEALYYWNAGVRNAMFCIEISTPEQFRAFERSGIPWSYLIAASRKAMDPAMTEIYEKLHDRGVMVIVSVTGSADRVKDRRDRRVEYLRTLLSEPDIIETDYPADFVGLPVGREELRAIRDREAERMERPVRTLVVGLGNPEATPDALGPKMVSNLLITRHLIREYGREVMGVGDCCEIRGLAPGVMAQTGMETSEIIKGVVQEISPDLLIVIDALAARSTRRLCRTIQLTDTGIQPGSGVGNHRAALTKETLGIPVIAIGVPTVVEAAAIIYDAQGNCEQMPPHLNGMFVTPKNIDELIKQLSFTLSEALNMVFAHGER